VPYYGDDPLVSNAVDDLAAAGAAIAASGGTPNATSGTLAVPALFLTASPLKVWVTQDGLAGGAASAATVGALALGVVTVTPLFGS
jgi:hypothetical protein